MVSIANNHPKIYLRMNKFFNEIELPFLKQMMQSILFNHHIKKFERSLFMLMKKGET